MHLMRGMPWLTVFVGSHAKGVSRVGNRCNEMCQCSCVDVSPSLTPSVAPEGLSEECVSADVKACPALVPFTAAGIHVTSVDFTCCTRHFKHTRRQMYIHPCIETDRRVFCRESVCSESVSLGLHRGYKSLSRLDSDPVSLLFPIP